MYTHDITECNFYNIYYIIYICTHFNFLIYGNNKISIEIVIFFNYTHTNLENFSVIVFIYMLFI